MSNHCPFPIRSTDSRRCYRTGSAPGFTLCLALVAALSGYAGLSHAAPSVNAQASKSTATAATAQAYMGWARDRQLVVLRPDLPADGPDSVPKPDKGQSEG
jgi:hypothetical protein